MTSVLVVKNLPTNAGDMGLISKSGRSPGGGHGSPLQCSWRRDWQATVHRVAKIQGEPGGRVLSRHLGCGLTRPEY